MNIVVLVKQVPAISDIKIDVKDNNLVRVGAPSMMNPVDMHAIEAAVAVKDAVGDANITIMTMGTALAGEIMREGIALGINQGVLISDERMAGSDTLATGTILAKAIESIGGADLVFTGKRSTDGDTGQIPPALAQNLGMSLLSYAESFEIDGQTARITRKNHDGLETVEAPLPAVVSVMETMNTPRNPKIRGKMSAKKAVFQVLRLEDLGLDPDQAGKNGSATKVTELFAPESHPIGTMISGDTVEQAATKLVETLASKQLL